MSLLELRHLRLSDIAGRVAVLMDPHVRKNISSVPALCDDAALTAYFTDIVEGRNPNRVEFVLTKPDSTVVAYDWLHKVDWPSRTCEIGMITIPRFRFGYGLIAMLKTYEFAFGTLNMRSVLNEVHDDNEMMTTTETMAGRAQLVAVQGQFTEGHIRNSIFWTETWAELLTRYGRFLAPASPHPARTGAQDDS
jgi:hypothetical protein